MVFRTFGLSIISLSKLPFRARKATQEPLKTAIQRSRFKAFLRALIHVIPVGVALWLVALNWNMYYVGSFARNQLLYQLGAKIHEMTIQASLAAIIFSHVRHELTLGKGVPFGALFSGLQINQISYLWSMELWGSMKSSHLSSRRKLTLLVTIVVCFVLAVTAGPSSAILLIPRLDYWPAGTTHIWINLTSSETWPDR